MSRTKAGQKGGAIAMSVHEDEDHVDPNNITLGEVWRVVKRIDTAVNGNGQEGMRDKVNRHETYFKLVAGSLGLILVAIGMIQSAIQGK